MDCDRPAGFRQAESDRAPYATGGTCNQGRSSGVGISVHGCELSESAWRITSRPTEGEGLELSEGEKRPNQRSIFRRSASVAGK
ncbi:hypothetical protein HYPDE_28483 [Hyphomicrobium denitrificans 1NES1]|uniref:Uncharacterized protein n=1 Tax=Hyphomicrobium denitrificans 1NES1 TaxID=670307 RepID=N0BA04_9HYPH|nr:hypothetical protein HYPDE_28483 [Hyphomicrobium denitrificans 1NES1]